MLFESFNRVTNELTNIRTVDCMCNQKRSRRESNHRHTGLQPAALPTELSSLYMIPSTLLAPYVGEPYNQQVFEHLSSTVRQILFVFFIT